MSVGAPVKVTLWQGDCLDKMSTIPDGSVDMVLCDLPYGTTECKWDTALDLKRLWAHYKRVAKAGAAIVLTASQPFTTVLIASNLAMFRYEWIWEKPQGTNPMMARKAPLKSHENIAVFYAKQPTYNPQMETGRPYKGFSSQEGAEIGEHYRARESRHAANNGTRFPKSVLRFGQERDGFHPTQKPVPLGEYLICTYTNEGEVVLDNTMGSGSFGVAAVNTGRGFIGIERDEGYFVTAKRRIDDAVAKRAEEASRPVPEQARLF